MQAVKRIGGKTRDFFLRLHRDESGPNTIEWILLVVVALVVLIGVYAIVQWSSQETTNQGKEAANQRSSAVSSMKDITNSIGG